ncbi:MAG TPA: hypothetical protein VF559_03735 [Caulobacteraceae bacterium]|jgi:predicted esterase YcpF (UPF0227 family)
MTASQEPAPIAPQRAADVLRLAAIDAARAQPEAALARLDAYAEIAPLPKAAAVMRAQVLSRMGRLEEALEATRALREAYPEAVNIARLMGLLLYRSRMMGEFEEQFAEALERWPADPNLLMTINQLSTEDRVFDRFYAIVEERYGQVSFSPRAHYEYAIASLRFGKIEQAIAALDAIAARSAVAGRMRRGLSAFTPDEWRRRFRVRNDPSLAVQKVHKPGAEATVIVLPGARNRFDQLHISYLDALLHDLPVNVIYLTDPSLRSCVLGVPLLGKGPEETAAALKEIAHGFGSRRVYTMGSSMGGFSAVRYGGLIGADAVLTVSGYTKLNAAGEELEESERTFMKQPSREFSPEVRSIRANLESSPQMRLLQIVASDNPHDVRQAARVEDLPNVRSVRVPGVADHAGVVHGMIGTGEFQRLLAEWLV